MNGWELLPVICAAMFLTGVMDAIAGGGGLISLPVYLMAGLPVRTAYGTNKVMAFAGCCTSAWRYWKKGYLDPDGALTLAVPMVVGELAGTRLVYLLPESTLKTFLTVMLPIVALFTFFAKNAFQYDRLHCTPGWSRDRWLLLGTGLFMGLYSSLIAAAGATIGMILLSALLHYDVRTANGTLKLGLTAGSLVGIVIYAVNGNVNWVLALPAVLANMAGNYIGVGLAAKRGVGMIRPAALIVVAAYSIKTAYGFFLG